MLHQAVAPNVTGMGRPYLDEDCGKDNYIVPPATISTVSTSLAFIDNSREGLQDKD